MGSQFTVAIDETYRVTGATYVWDSNPADYVELVSSSDYEATYAVVDNDPEVGHYGGGGCFRIKCSINGEYVEGLFASPNIKDGDAVNPHYVMDTHSESGRVSDILHPLNVFVGIVGTQGVCYQLNDSEPNLIYVGVGEFVQPQGIKNLGFGDAGRTSGSPVHWGAL